MISSLTIASTHFFGDPIKWGITSAILMVISNIIFWLATRIDAEEDEGKHVIVVYLCFVFGVSSGSIAGVVLSDMTEVLLIVLAASTSLSPGVTISFAPKFSKIMFWIFTPIYYALLAFFLFV